MRCEDYPCCGHTDGLPCDWKPPTEYPHAGCDHNAGYCQVADEEEDEIEEEYQSPEPAENEHLFTHARFTGAVTCSRCGLLPLDSDDYESECEGDR